MTSPWIWVTLSENRIPNSWWEFRSVACCSLLIRIGNGDSSGSWGAAGSWDKAQPLWCFLVLPASHRSHFHGVGSLLCCFPFPVSMLTFQILRTWKIRCFFAFFSFLASLMPFCPFLKWSKKFFKSGTKLDLWRLDEVILKQEGQYCYSWLISDLEFPTKLLAPHPSPAISSPQLFLHFPLWLSCSV